MLLSNTHIRTIKFRTFLEIIIFIILNFVVLVEAAMYYVDATAGNDLNSGLSETTAWKTIGKVRSTSFSPGDFILFKRGEMWREQLVPNSGDSSGYITYGAYGTGSKPLLLGSVTKNDVSDWTNEAGNIWSTPGITVDVGNIIFNDESLVGVKVRTESELDTEGEFWYDETNSILKLYSQINPALYYSTIECALKRHIILQSGQGYIIYENLDLRYGGAHGVSAVNVHNTIVRDSDFSFIGGARQGGEVRYGNGIEFWSGSHDTVVERCRLWDIYDAALTTQGGGNAKYSQIFRNNIVWNSEYCFEFWNRPASTTTDNVYFKNNTCVNAGYGWGHNQRWLETDAGWHNGRHLAFYNNSASTTNLYVTNNIFYEGRNSLFVLWENWNGIENLVSDNNLWYQSSGVMIYYWCSSNMCTGIYSMFAFPQYQTDTGKDSNSLAADPLFNDIVINDFRPVAESPACTMSETGSYVGAIPCVDINDTDGDRMPDSFETLYSLDPNNPADADYDNDSDNLSNYWEYTLGTDPTDPDTDSDGIGDASDTCPVSSPVNVASTGYSSLQSAYDESADNELIKSQNTVFTENLIFDINKSTTIETGYDCSYTTNNGSSTVNGDMTISSGTVTIQGGTLEVQ